MSKHPRKKRAKRSTKKHGRQRRQLLMKEVRALYQPGLAGSDPDPEWHVELEEDLGVAPRRGRGKGYTPSSRPDAAPPAAPSDSRPAGQELRGRVVAVFSGACRVARGDHDFECILPSDIARDQRAAVAVGDDVVFAAHGAGAYRLRRVLPRRTILSRPDPHNPRRERVIAANIDIAVHVASVVEPPLCPALVDRYLIAVERGGADAVICVNKIDLIVDDSERQRQLERLACYRRRVKEILPTSAVTGEGMDALRTLLAGKITVFVGHSGVGKSSLLNALSPGLGAVTARTRAGKGRHTTTRSSFYRINGDSRVIDTPGIRELGLWKLTTCELRAYFPDFDQHTADCRFNNCSHSHEPDCGVRAAVDSGGVSQARFDTYLRILDSLAPGD